MSTEYEYPTFWSCLWYKEGKCFYSEQEIKEHLETYLEDYYIDSNFRWRLFWLYCDIGHFFFHLYLIKRGRGPYKSLHTDEKWGYWEYIFIFAIRNPILDIFWSIYDFIKYKIFRIEYVDPHIGCYSYPNCDEAPMGCKQVWGDEAEPYGHRD